MRKPLKEFFNDGVMGVLEVDKRTIKRTIHECVHFGNRTIGVVRSYQASIVGENISRLVSVPFNNLIEQSNVIEICGDFYSIKRIQVKHETLPPSMYLTLEKNGVPYVDNRAKS